MTVKGDVDNLGRIFQAGLAQPTFARMVALSRQINAFFAVWLPAWCATHYPDTYTVFAGGDDFFLIGPWHATQRLTADMAAHFTRYVAGNPEPLLRRHGHEQARPAHPHPRQPGRRSPRSRQGPGQERPRQVPGQRVAWADWPKLAAAADELDGLDRDYRLSTGYRFCRMLRLVDLASAPHNPESPLWRSRFAYRTRRYVVDKLPPAARATAQAPAGRRHRRAGHRPARRRLPHPLLQLLLSPTLSEDSP